MLILQFLLKVSVNSISIFSSFFCLGIENLDSNNKSNKYKVEAEIKLEDKINKDILICQTNKANSQC